MEEHQVVSEPDISTYIIFFVTDRIQANEMKVECYPTEMMIADFYTKPLQGKLFRLFRNLILNLREEDMRNITLLEKLTKMKSKDGRCRTRDSSRISTVVCCRR